MKKRPLLATLAVVAGLAFPACGSDEPSAARSDDPDAAVDAGAGTGSGFPVTIETAEGPVEIDERPERIVSLSPTATEILFAIDGGDQVVAVDDESNFPADVPTTDLSGYEPNLEAIAGYQPDLVVAFSDPGDLVEGLAALDIPTIVQPAAETLDDTYAQIDQLGQATGNREAADELSSSIEERIAELSAEVPEREVPLTYLHELDSSLFTVTSDTYIGQLYSMAGFRSIADDVDDGTSGGYPQLSAEAVLQADPDVIFLADTKCCGQSVETVAQRPGWASLGAVRSGRVVELDDDVASRWGPRVVELFEILVAASVDAGEPGPRS